MGWDGRAANLKVALYVRARRGSGGTWRTGQNDLRSSRAGPGTMTLRLRIVSDHRRLLGDRSTVLFSENGGTIGRSADNDWVLPDPVRYVSAHHARVHFRDGHFFLEDVSTNGVFVNDDDKPLARAGAEGHQLRSGDLIRMGDYQIVAALETEPEEATTPKPDTGAGQVPTSIHALRTLGRAAQTDIGAMLDLDDLLVPDSSPSDSFRPVNAYGQAVAQAPARAAVARPTPAPAVPTEEEAAIERRIARLARAAARDPKNGPSVPALFDVSSGLQAFCRGAGIEADKLPADAQTRMLHLAGQLFRESLVGLKELERARNDTRNRYRIELPTEADDPRPSLARST